MQKLLSFTCLFFTLGCGGMMDGAKVNANDAQNNLTKLTDKGTKPLAGNFCKMEDILHVIRENQNTINHCFKKEFALNNKLSGKVVLCWTILVNGEVRQPQVCSSTLQNVKVESCMVNALEQWQFVKPNGGICEIKFPFVFKLTDKW